MGLNSPLQELSHQSPAFFSLVPILPNRVCEGLDARDKIFWVNLHEMEQWDYGVHESLRQSSLKWIALIHICFSSPFCSVIFLLNPLV